MTLPIKYRSLWLVIAILTGWIIATQSFEVVLSGGLLLIYGLLAAITPVSAIIFLLILAPLRTLFATEASFQLPLDIGQLLLIGTLAVWLFHSILLRRSLPRISRNPIYTPLVLVLIATGTGLFTALSLASWLSEWLKWIQVLIVAVVTLSLVSDRQWQWLIFGLMMAGTANALIGIYEFFGGSGALHLLVNDRFFRAFGTFGQPNPFGGFMGLLAPLALMMTLGHGLRWWRTRKQFDLILLLFYAVAASLMLAGIIVSWSRGAWLAFAVAGVVMFLALPRKLGRGLALAGILVCLTAVLWTAGLLPASVIERVSSSTEEFFAFEDMRGVDITSANYPVVERLAHWQAALNMARQYPWFGVGFGNYEIAYPDFRLLNWDEPLGHAHNYYLNMLAESGLIGLLGYGKAWLMIMWLTWQARQHPDTLSRLVVIGFLGTWVYLSIHSLFDNLYVNNLFLHVGLMLGIMGLLYNQVRSTTSLRLT